MAAVRKVAQFSLESLSLRLEEVAEVAGWNIEERRQLESAR